MTRRDPTRVIHAAGDARSPSKASGSINAVTHIGASMNMPLNELAESRNIAPPTCSQPSL